MATSTPSLRRPGLVLATLILGASVANLNLSVANVTLPTIGRDLDASQAALNLVAIGFTLGLAASVLYLGAIADHYGRRRLLLIGLALSIPTAIIAAWAPNTEILTLGRLLGGIAAGMAYPTTLSIVMALFDGPSKTKAIALWSGIGAAATSIGPAIAGYLIEHYWWGSAFAMTIPFAVIGLVMAYAFVPKKCGEEAGVVDHRGGVLSVIAIGGLTLCLHFLPTPGSLDLGLVFGVVAVVAFVAFALWERRAPNPLFDLAVARRRPFWVAAIAGMIVFGSLVGSMFIGQQYMQNVLSYTAFEAGIAIIPATVGMIVCSPLAARLMAARGGWTSFVVGFIAIIAGLAMMFTWREGAPYVFVGISYGLLGIGIGFAGAPASRAVMTSVPLKRAGMGSGTTDLQRDLGAAIMQSILGAFLTFRYAAEMRQQLAQAPADERSKITTETAATLQNSFGGAVDLAQRYPKYADQITDAAREAFVRGSAVAIAAGVIAVILGLILVAVLFPRKDREMALEEQYAKAQ